MVLIISYIDKNYKTYYNDWRFLNVFIKKYIKLKGIHVDMNITFFDSYVFV